MLVWEHSFYPDVMWMEVQKLLMVWQKDGWELVSSHRYNLNYGERDIDSGVYYDLFFKRPKRHE